MGRTRGATASGGRRAPAGPTRRAAAAAVVGALGISNVVTNRALPDAAYVPWNLTLAAGLLALARAAGVTPRDLGMASRDAPRSAVAGALGAAAVAAGYGVALRAGPGAVLQDDRATSLTPRQARYDALVRIPLGTVVAEEVAFRGVLPALLGRPGGRTLAGDTVASLLFGLWHVLPSRDLAAANAAAGRVAGRLGPTGTAALAVAATAVPGAGLLALRRRTGHLLAPMLVHWASNALGVVAARTAARR